MNKLIIILICSCSFIRISAQEFELPAGYQFKTRLDYIQYEKDVINASKWLQGTPFNEQVSKRKDISTFVASWVNGNPVLHVEISPAIIEFEKRNPGMLVLYLAGNARFVLENNNSKDKQAGQKAALKGMIEMYKAGKGVQKDKKMEKLIRADEKGKIDAWVVENLKMEQKDFMPPGN